MKLQIEKNINNEELLYEIMRDNGFGGYYNVINDCLIETNRLDFDSADVFGEIENKLSDDNKAEYKNDVKNFIYDLLINNFKFTRSV